MLFADLKDTGDDIWVFFCDRTCSLFEFFTFKLFYKFNISCITVPPITRLPLPKLKRLQLPLSPDKAAEHIEGFKKMCAPALQVIDLLFGGHWRDFDDVETHIADIRTAIDGNADIPAGVKVNNILLIPRLDGLQEEWRYDNV